MTIGYEKLYMRHFFTIVDSTQCTTSFKTRCISSDDVNATSNIYLFDELAIIYKGECD